MWLRAAKRADFQTTKAKFKRNSYNQWCHCQPNARKIMTIRTRHLKMVYNDSRVIIFPHSHICNFGNHHANINKHTNGMYMIQMMIMVMMVTMMMMMMKVTMMMTMMIMMLIMSMMMMTTAMMIKQWKIDRPQMTCFDMACANFRLHVEQYHTQKCKRSKKNAWNTICPNWRRHLLSSMFILVYHY